MSISIDNLHGLYKTCSSVETDTRKIRKSSMFFALKGPNFNGNNFVSKALEAGANFCIADEDVGFKDERVVYVEDALATLQNLAKYHRKRFNIPFLAITGSNGKTTTKELVHEVLSKKYKCYTTVGNLNNHIGVPLTLLSIQDDAEIAIVEMGANHQKEIEFYCTIANPTLGLVTNVGKAHLEGFGGVEGVKKGKGELYDHIRERNGTAFICSDLEYLQEMSKGISKTFTYGTQKGEIVGNVLGKNEYLHVAISKGANLPNIATKLVGDYNLPNVLAAVALGKFFGVSDDYVLDALENYTPTNSRSQMLVQNSNKIILDAYNANPSSMKEAIENFDKLPDTNKIAILGGMKELGADSDAEHIKLLELLATKNWKAIVVAGKEFKNVPKGILHFESADGAKEWYQLQNFENALILVKGSRSLQMEKVIE